ncbi:FGGY-family carbohydrate kinase [Diplocloster hominis]|uniref:FGGY-family carbohydrate kinase n=1 Tax=Diplocloster hominis TaxID=3079010 RepID=UPI0031BB6CB9
MSLMGIDIGTTGCKVCAFAEDGTLLSRKYREYGPRNHSSGIPNEGSRYEESYTGQKKRAVSQSSQEQGRNKHGRIIQRDGIYELDSEQVIIDLFECIQAVNHEVKKDPVTALAASVSGDEFVPAGQHGEPLGPVIMSMDERGREETKQLLEQYTKEELYQMTGLPLHHKYGLLRMLWYQNNRPDLEQRIGRYLSWEDLIFQRLAGEDIRCSGRSVLARFMLIDIRTNRYSDKLLQKYSIPEDRLSAPVDPGTVVGMVQSAISEQLGFRSPPLLVAGGFDQSCAALGAGVYKKDSAMVGTGTMESLSVCSERPILSSALLAGGYPCNHHVIPGSYTCTATNVCGGAMLKWVRDQLGREEKQKAAAAGTDVYSELLAQCPDGPTGLLVLPHFAGSGPPSKDAGALGAILGLRLSSTREDLIKGVLEGVTYELRQNMEQLERGCGRPLPSLYASGGGAGSDFWLQLKADITGKTIYKVSCPEAGCAAAAMLAGIGAGIYTDLPQTVPFYVKTGGRFYTNRKNYNIYTEFYEEYVRIYPATAGISHRIGEIRKEGGRTRT